MGIRAAVFDEWVTEKLIAFSGSTVIHIGCGMDSRVLRVGADHRWYDVDFPEVIKERKKYYTETESYTMLEGDARANDWLALIPDGNSAVVIMEGISMYLKTDELTALLENIGRKYQNVTILMDCYTVMAAKMSKYKNPINDVGVTTVHGIDDPELINGGGISFVKEHVMTPRKYIDELSGIEKAIFKRLYAGGLSKKLYRLFEFEKATERK